MYLPCQWVTHLCPRTIPYWFKIKHSFMLLHTDPQIAQPANAPTSPDSSPLQGQIQEFLIGRGGGGGPNFGSEWTVELFCGKLLLPHIPSHQSQLHIICHVVAVIVDQLRKQRQPLVSQSVNAGCHWCGKYCFARRGEQIIGGYSKTITFLNIPGIQFSGKMQMRISLKKSDN